MASATIEDYLKQIYLQQDEASGLAPMGRLADAMEVTPGTATAMVKRLSESSLVEYEPYTGVRLTERGRTMALQVLRRHRLIESFLVDALGLDWSQVHEEAERLEHAISDRLLERIDVYLGRPRTDPHGDPIPDSSGHLRERSLVSLSACEPGGRYRIERVLDQDQRFLRFVDERGLKPGAEVTIEHLDPVADSITVRVNGERITMGLLAAAKLLAAPA